MNYKRLRYTISLALASLLVTSHVTPLALAQEENLPDESEVVQQQEATFPVGVEVRSLNGTRTDQVDITLYDSNGVEYDGSYNENTQWISANTFLEGEYFISLTTPEGTISQINNTAPQYAVPTETPNVYSIYLDEENLGSLSAVYGAFQLVEEPVSATYRIGTEIRGLDGTRTTDVGITVSDVNGMVYEGAFNEYAQWLTTNELPEGVYYITLSTPEGTMSQISTSASQSAVATDTPNLYTIELNEATLGNLSAVYGAFELIEVAPIEQNLQLAAEVRGIDGTRTSDVAISVSDVNGIVYEGTYNEYLQWLTTELLPEGEFFITLTPPEGFTTELNLSTDQYAMDTDTPNVYSIFLNEDNLGSSSAVYGAFNLVEAPVEETFRLGVEVRGLNQTRTDEVGVTVTDANDLVYEGTYNEYLQWLTTEELPAGQYTITLDTPEGTVSTINDSTDQYAIPADDPNVYNIILNEENIGSSSAVYGAFRLVEVPAETYQLGVEVRGLDDTRTDSVLITVTDSDGVVFEGAYNEYFQWLTDNELPVGTYIITLDTPEGTVSEINETTNQYAVSTNETDVYTIEINEENLGSSSAIYGAFRLVETPAEAYQLGVEVRGLDDRRTDEVDVTVTNPASEVFTGSYNQYFQWLTDNELPVGTYIITLGTPEGTVSEINETTNQYAVSTDQTDVYTIEINEENLGSSSAIYGAFRLVETDDNGGGSSESSDESDDESSDESDSSDDESDKGSVIVDQDDDVLPRTGENNSIIITVIAVGLLAVGGLLLYRKKRS